MSPLILALLLTANHPRPIAYKHTYAVIATAYCLGGFERNAFTATGERVGPGVVAVDPILIPLGSTVQIHVRHLKGYDGPYRAIDTGGAIKGYRVDVWMSSCVDAENFGVQWADISL